MRRLFSRVYGAVAVTLPLLAVATAIVHAEGADPGATPAPQAAAAPAPEKKKLNTIPEDGIPGAELLVPNKLVRDFMAKRPNEDLIICVAGCYSHRDKIVYAQPIEVPPMKPAMPVAESAPVSIGTPSTAAGSAPAGEKPATEPASAPMAESKPASASEESAGPTVINAAPPAAAGTPEPAKDAGVKSQMLPTMSEDNGASPKPEPGAAAPEAPSENPPAQDGEVPPESRDSER